jgi:DNA (cytosine-5)-methyltransferase 1
VSIEIGREVFGTPWMNIEEMAECIPPAYTKWIGQQLLRELSFLSGE